MSKMSVPRKQKDNAHTSAQDDNFHFFHKDKKLKRTVEQQFASILSKSSTTTSNKVATIAPLPSLSDIVGTTGTGTSSNQGMVTAFISSRPLNVSSSNINQNTPGTTQPLLLPKPPNVQQKIIPETPTKFNYNPNSPAPAPIHQHGSPTHSWQSGSPCPLNRKRVLAEFDSDIYDSKRRKTPTRCGPEKGGKGLRHFSMKVCEKVQKKGITSYNEVADELVQEFTEQCLKNPLSTSEQSYDQKNIRRRVYDALNVLMAMNIISKEKKEIKWVGLPTNSAQECKHLEDQKLLRTERIHQKQQQLKELIVQQIAYKNLVERNKKVEKKNGPPQANACIHLPFIVVNTSKKTVIDCSISSDKSEYLFNFDEAFEIHDDIEVLKIMGLSYGLEKGVVSENDLKSARNMVPKSLEPYVLQMASGTYGDMDLIELGREGRRSSFQTETFMSTLGPSHKLLFRKTPILSSSSSSNQTSKLAEPLVSSPSVGSGYDTDNDREDENINVME